MNITLDLVFPPRCAVCDKVGSFICPDCFSEILIIKEQVCPRCNRISPKGKVCLRCRRHFEIGGIIALGYFKSENLKKTIHEIKYNHYYTAVKPLAEELSKSIQTEGVRFDAIAFVPSSKKRERKRGYNQAEVLARELALIFNVPRINGLKKIKNTPPQVGLKKKARLKNLSGAFCCQKITGYKKILLVDDVATTGATLNNCAEALKKAGAKSVWGAVLARE